MEILRSLEQFILTVKGQNNFWCRNAFLTCSRRFLRSNKLEQVEFKLEKLLGFKNMQEKLENIPLFSENEAISLIGPWMTMGWFWNDLWKPLEWHLINIFMTSGWPLDGFWMTSGLLPDDFWMTFGWLLDDLRTTLAWLFMTTGWIWDDFWINLEWLIDEFQMNLLVSTRWYQQQRAFVSLT